LPTYEQKNTTEPASYTVVEEAMKKETYHAPFGMSSFDFNSLIRKRSLAHLTRQLVEQGRVHLPGSSNTTVNTIKHDVANTPDPPLIDIDEITPLPRPISSKYSHDTDGNSFCPTTPIDTPSTGKSSRTSVDPTSMALPLSKNSSCASLPCPAEAPTSSATSASIHQTLPDAVTAAKETDHAPGLFSLVKKGLRASSIKSQSLPSPTSENARTMKTDHAPRRPKLYGQARVTVTQAKKDPLMDLRVAVAALLKQHEQRNKPQELHPPVDQIFELGRVRRAIRTLSFDADDTIMLASDLTSLVPMPSLQSPQESSEMEGAEDVLETRKFFRDRLASTVQRQITRLRLEGKLGNVLRIEHWYRDVVDLVGWRDEEEARQSWSWLENDGFF
jgi:hypothetical protein